MVLSFESSYLRVTVSCGHETWCPPVPGQVHVETLAAVKLEKHKNLGEEFSFFWREIDEGSLAFDRVQTEVRILNPKALKSYIWVAARLGFVANFSSRIPLPHHERDCFSPISQPASKVISNYARFRGGWPPFIKEGLLTAGV
jgi:hypothetical protein